ncbi:MAG TPA: hypothetical protein DDX98_13950 [Bacteroidales bacterium]|jgi:O-antigen/teichoic acid export membrane protein|nr:hypothetical protein [Bacteroidales bacterium]
MTFKEKLIRGGIWNAVSQFGAQGINFVIIIILARLLSPNDFGLLGMVTVITGFLSYFSEFGMIASIIKKPQIDDLDCNTAFWSGIAFSIIVYSIIYFTSPLISWFYNQPELTDISRVVSLVFVIGSYSFVPAALEMKRLRYNRIAIIRLVSLIISGPIAIFSALKGFGVWALVFQLLIMEIVAFLGYLFWVNWKPKFKFSFLRFNGLFSFGMHITLNNLIKFFSENIDYLLVGKMLGPTALGLYTMAFRLSRYPIEKIGPIFKNMLFPAFASIQNDSERIRINVIRVSAVVPLVTVPFLFFFYFSSDVIVGIIVGNKWMDAVPMIKIFIVYLFIYSFSFPDEPVMMVTGKIKQLNLIKIIMSLVLLFSGYIMVANFGVKGMTITYTSILSVYYISIKMFTLELISTRFFAYMSIMKNVYFYCLWIFIIAIILSYCVPSTTISGTIIIGIGILTITLISVLTYLRIITFKPFKLDFDRCLIYPETN